MSRYAHNEVLVFDGTVRGLCDNLQLLLATQDKIPAFVQDSDGETFDRIRLTVTKLSDGSESWDITLERKRQ